MMDIQILLFNSLSKTGDLVEQVLNSDDDFLDHVDFLHQPFFFWLLQQKIKTSKNWRERIHE